MVHRSCWPGAGKTAAYSTGGIWYIYYVYTYSSLASLVGLKVEMIKHPCVPRVANLLFSYLQASLQQAASSSLYVVEQSESSFARTNSATRKYRLVTISDSLIILINVAK